MIIKISNTMKKLKLSFVTLITLVLGTIIFIGCSSEENDSNINTGNLQYKTVSYRSILENLGVSQEIISEFEDSLEHDDDDRVVSFTYNNIKSSLIEEEYVGFLMIVSNSDILYLDEDRFVMYEGRVMADKDFSLVPSDPVITPTPHIFHNKRNWKRPGCLS